jgi:hypothetical protein
MSRSSAARILAGVISVQAAAAAVIAVALIGYVSGRQVPPAPPIEDGHRIDLNVFRSSARLVAATLHIPRLFLAIVAISFFWTIGAVLFIQFPPLVKNVLYRRPAGGEPVPRHLLGRSRDRIGRDQPAAEGRGFGPLIRALGDRDGRVRLGFHFARATGRRADRLLRHRRVHRSSRRRPAPRIAASASPLPAACSWCRSTPSSPPP